MENLISYLESYGVNDLLIFFCLAIISFVIAGYIPPIITFILSRVAKPSVVDIYDKLIVPVSNLIKILIAFISIYFWLYFLLRDEKIYDFFRIVIDLATVATTGWLFSRLWSQFLRVYGIHFLRKLGYEIDDLVVIAETVVNITIGVIAAFAFAGMRKMNLIAPLAGLGIGGLAVAFAAQKTLEQLLGTLVLYLDKPFVPGEYIRIPSSGQLSQGLFGRVESIGLRSSKIRTAAKGTLIIVPNSTLANLEIENITRGKKVMVLLYLDFNKLLADKEEALVKQVIQESTNAIPGIDLGSTSIYVAQNQETEKSRARVTFFILGSSENSIELRKRLLELANEKVSLQLKDYGIEFEMQEPNIYIESPITV